MNYNLDGTIMKLYAASSKIKCYIIATFSKDNRDFSLNVIEVMLLLFGLIGAVLAYHTYVKQNTISENNNKLEIRSMLKDIDREINGMVLEYPIMDTLWTKTVGITDGKQQAYAKIESIFKYSLKYSNNETIIEEIHPELLWNNISEFSMLLWGDKQFDNLYLSDLRKVYTLAETILYLIVDALELEDEGYLTSNETDTYIAHLRTLGSHPLFLHALWFGHNNGHISKNIVNRICKELLSDKTRREQIRAIYPELIDEFYNI